MDLAAILEREKAKRKRPLASTEPNAENGNGNDDGAGSGGEGRKKFVRKGEILSEKEKVYREEQKKRDEEKEKKRREKLGLVDEDELFAANKPKNLEKKKQSEKTFGERVLEDDSQLPEPTLPVDEVISMLRRYNQVATYFAETVAQRAERLRRFLLKKGGDEMGGMDNTFNELLRKDDEEFISADASDKKKEKKQEWDAENEAALQPTPYVEGQEVQDYIRGEVKKYLANMDRDLALRPETDRKTPQFKRDRVMQQQTAEYLKPLLKKLKKVEVPEEQVEHFVGIFDNLAKREYVAANDVYLGMAIGNAPWPMGVTQVGIHERAGRTKIFSQKISHVLNDETTRKYIQAVKRLMTYAQKRFPTDPSKMVG
eukprot:TRINITY_DN924_c0_g1::TRINITY_DN924_c0_g1_i1::g.15976::m.15976 TRINITY_DN924_c0_g1::TRINITY_DN924_c0_g1_i1::g.15976  ORF type:complete len:385 (-),score=101.39,sp/Q5RE03/PRP18_PONAB/39.69/9e-46,Prp18/PF02840.10/8.5e+03,Prp18/PF02840.10/2.9e-49,PRP4/PF08799.6/4.1e-06 TRINITY_DN924_c0_g1_i1:694-1806(-)